MKSRGPSRYPYQEEDSQKIADLESVILAHAPGCGKTSIAIDSIRKAEVKHALIVVPNSLKTNWANEISKWSDVEPVIVTGSPVQRQSLLSSTAPIKVINYEIIEKHSMDIISQGFDFIAFDESHRLKNRSAKVTRAATKISRTIPRKVFMSGTPLTRSVVDLFPIFQMIDPKRFSSYWKFVSEFAIQYHNGFSWEVKDITDPEDPRLVRLRSILGERFIRRTLEDVFEDFPSLNIILQEVETSPEQRRIYKQLKKEFFTSIGDSEIFVDNPLTLITRLKQILLDPRLATDQYIPYLEGAKVNRLIEILDEIGDEPLVVFTQFASAIGPLVRRLQKEGITSVEYSGQITQDHCNENESIWKSGQAQVLIAGIDKGGVGHTWTRAKYGLLLDKKYLPHENEQAIKRIHRISQNYPVTVWELITPNSVEEKIERVLNERRDLAENVITRTMLEQLLED